MGDKEEQGAWHIACICAFSKSALFALNANEEKISGVSLHVLVILYLPRSLNSKFAMCPNKETKISLSFPAFSPSELYTFHPRH